MSQRFQIDRLREEGRAFVEFLRTTNLSAGVYRIPAGGEDPQQPHREEEIYYVVRGKAGFLAGNEDRVVGAGDILHVPAGERHRFHDVEEDLELLVLFAPPEGAE